MAGALMDDTRQDERIEACPAPPAKAAAGLDEDADWEARLSALRLLTNSDARSALEQARARLQTLLDNLTADYVRTAKAKGLGNGRIVFVHVLRNSLIPVAATIGANLGFFLTGSFLIEVTFNIPGLGLLGYDALVRRDFPVFLGLLTLSSLAMLIGNIVSDLCVAAVDPRIRFDKSA
jgi:ABC-type dipeptide/oligopeptide/nickel transport system permease component